eukprot:scaffold131301_cov63-Phaeocystis_antarctica.AAC.2
MPSNSTSVSPSPSPPSRRVARACSTTSPERPECVSMMRSGLPVSDAASSNWRSLGSLSPGSPVPRSGCGTTVPQAAPSRRRQSSSAIEPAQSATLCRCRRWRAL